MQRQLAVVPLKALPAYYFFIADLSENSGLDKFLKISFVNLSKIREIKI